MNFVLAFLFIFAQQTFNPDAFCKDAKERQLCVDLLNIQQRDQTTRKKWIADRDNKALRDEVERIDKEDLAQIESVIAKYGYPGKSLVGQNASGVAWLVIQHADLATQKKYIDMMTAAAEKGDLDYGLVATTIDRIRVREGKPQLYGTQFHESNGEWVPDTIEDPANVDVRRAKAGMGTLADYTTELRKMYGPATPAKKSAVIARVWRGRVPTARADEYSKYLYDNGILKIRGIGSNLGAQMLRRADGDVTEFMVISYWPSRDAIKAFAGDDIEKAHFLPRDREFLINPDEFVRHYEVSAEEWAATRK